MFEIMQEDVIRVSAFVPQPAAFGVAPGVDAVVRVPELPDREFPGKVTRIADALHPGTRTLLTEIDIPNPDGALTPPASGSCAVLEKLGIFFRPSPRPPAGGKYASKEVGMRSATEPEAPKRPADGIANRDSLTGDRGFESISLQRGVCCEPYSLDRVIAKSHGRTLLQRDWKGRGRHRDGTQRSAADARHLRQSRRHTSSYFDLSPSPRPKCCQAIHRHLGRCARHDTISCRSRMFPPGDR
jgi:hypothetical protein